jgi:hypothetical protein
MLAAKKLLEKPASHFWLVVLGASLLALGLYGYVISPGLAGTADSYHYLSAAYNLQTKGQLLLADGSVFRWWPPLFVVVLSAIGSSGGVQWLNGLALVGSLVMWSAVGYRLLPSRRAWALPLLLALSSPTLAVSKFIWSEPLFNWLWASYFMVLLAWLRRGGWRLGLLATALGCLLPLQRIVGLFLVAGVGVGLAWSGSRRIARPSGLAQLLHLLGASSGLLTWQVYHSLAVGDAFGPPLSLPQAAADYGFALGRWLVPLPLFLLNLVPSIFWSLLLLVIILLLWPRPTDRQPTGNGWPLAWVGLSSKVLYAAFTSMLAALILSVMRARAGHGLQEAERYATALYPALVLLLLLAWPSRWQWARRVGPGFLAIWLLYQGIRIAHGSYQLHHLHSIEINYPHPSAWWETAGSTAARLKPGEPSAAGIGSRALAGCPGVYSQRIRAVGQQLANGAMQLRVQ